LTEFYGHKNLLVKQHKIGQSCTLFSKAWVFQSLSKIPHATYPLVPLFRQVWSQRTDASYRGSGACTPMVEF